MNILFICTYNRWRSLTAEKLFEGQPGLRVKSAGIASTARVRVSEKLINWADTIFVMEPRHQEFLIDNFSQIIVQKQIICMDIESGYRFNDPELIHLLEEGVMNNFAKSFPQETSP